MKSLVVNLLPPEALASYRHGRRYLILSRILTAIGVLLVILLVFTGMSWEYLRIINGATKEQLNRTAESQRIKEANTFEKNLRDFSAELSLVKDLKKPQYDPSILTRDVLRVMPGGVRLQTFNITFQSENATTKEKQDNRQRLYMTGRATTRADYLVFAAALEKLKSAEIVNGPLQNIIKPTNADFSIEIILRSPTEETIKPSQL